MKIDRVLTAWQSDPSIDANIIAWQTQPAQQATWNDFPSELDPTLVASLNDNNIRQLYSHQHEAWQEIKKGHHIVVVTGTSSGKTLCYNLPVLDYIFSHPKARALYFFPTKALAQDQVQSLRKLVPPGVQQLKQPTFEVYDGDTPSDVRPVVRKNTNIILTNPDMIHIGILPHHTIWQDFFRNLKFIVIDEMHSYRGVFGSHVANLLRRLRRVARFYGSDPQFILTSATIANPAALAERLVEAPVSLIDKDGANHGARHFLIYNPPVVDRNTGLRRSSILESVQLAADLLDYGVQSIIFSRTRRSVELALTYLRSKSSDPDNIHGYRSGYLPAERRAIERGLKNGDIRAVVATNALELGIDIGGMDAVVMIGYPGTIAATRQEAGRAGRKADNSLAVLVASADPLDQFLAHHPEYLFEQSPEQALIQPDHLLIVLNHIRCAAFELPFKNGKSFGAMRKETVAEFLQFLEASGLLHQSRGQFYWMADQYPANEISLRSSSPGTFLLQVENENQRTTIGQVDDPSAYWMVHPQAIYFHEGQQYLVKELDIPKKIALLEQFHLDYFTEPLKETTVEQNSTLKKDPVLGGGKHLANWW